MHQGHLNTGASEQVGTPRPGRASADDSDFRISKVVLKNMKCPGQGTGNANVVIALATARKNAGDLIVEVMN